MLTGGHEAARDVALHGRDPGDRDLVAHEPPPRRRRGPGWIRAVELIATVDPGTVHEEEGRAFQQDRLALFGKVGAVFFLASEVAVRHRALDLGVAVAYRPFLAAAAMHAAIWAACRLGVRSAPALRWIDASSLVL